MKQTQAPQVQRTTSTAEGMDNRLQVGLCWIQFAARAEPNVIRLHLLSDPGPDDQAQT